MANRSVKIMATRNANNKIEFEMKEGGGPDTEVLVFNKTKDGMPKSEYYFVEFTLENERPTPQKPGTNLAFVTDVNKVMYVAKGSDKHLPKCNRAIAAPAPNGEFEVTGVTANTLKVTNKDDDDCFYKFVLNFVDQDNGNKVVLDPIWGNQDGGYSLISPNVTTALVSSAIAGAAVTLLTNAGAASTNVLIGAGIGAIIGFIAAFILEMARRPSSQSGPNA